MSLALHTEKALEDEICADLAALGWHYDPTDNSRYDRTLALFPDDLIAWVKKTQPQSWSSIEKSHGAQAGKAMLERLRKTLNEHGTLVHFALSNSEVRMTTRLAGFESGKTNSIAWTAHFLADLHDANNQKVFHTMIVVSDRTVIDHQLQEADGGEVSIEDALIAQMEAKAGNQGITFVAFTATPKDRTLQLFGTRPDPARDPAPDNIPRAFHVYSMRQAIEEGFILDVLQNYTSYKIAFNLAHEGRTICESGCTRRCGGRGCSEQSPLLHGEGVRGSLHRIAGAAVMPGRRHRRHDRRCPPGILVAVGQDRRRPHRDGVLSGQRGRKTVASALSRRCPQEIHPHYYLPVWFRPSTA